jgi:hypothetical protein
VVGGFVARDVAVVDVADAAGLFAVAVAVLQFVVGRAGEDDLVAGLDVAAVKPQLVLEPVVEDVGLDAGAAADAPFELGQFAGEEASVGPTGW